MFFSHFPTIFVDQHNEYSIPFLVLINYLASMRFDAYKVCKVRRRPLAKRTGGIGVWEHLLNLVTVVGVLTNCLLVAFFHTGTRELLERFDSKTGTVLIVIAWEHGMLFIKYLMGNMISQLPKKIRDEIKQKQHESENERYENLRLKTEQTRRLKREKSMSGSFRLLSITPEPVSRAGNSVAPNELDSLLTTPKNDGRLQTIVSFEGQTDDRSVTSIRPGMAYESPSGVNSPSEDEGGADKTLDTSTSEKSSHLQASVSFEESLNEGSKGKTKPAHFYGSMLAPSQDLEVEEEVDEIPFEDTLNNYSFIESKPGELFEC